MREYQASVHGILPTFIKAHSFGMPLQAKNRQGFMYNGFYNPVVGSLDDGQTLSQIFDSLMVRTVDREIGSIDLSKYASRNSM